MGCDIRGGEPGLDAAATVPDDPEREETGASSSRCAGFILVVGMSADAPESQREAVRPGSPEGAGGKMSA